jgi:hypothetical protein
MQVMRLRLLKGQRRGRWRSRGIRQEPGYGTCRGGGARACFGLADGSTNREGDAASSAGAQVAADAEASDISHCRDWCSQDRDPLELGGAH